MESTQANGDHTLEQTVYQYKDQFSLDTAQKTEFLAHYQSL